MKAVIIKDYGDTSKLTIADIEKPEPGEGEVLVKINTSGINPIDYKTRQGYLKDRFPYSFPLILGFEMAGVVEKTGFSARRFNPGDKVYAYVRRPFIGKGSYAEFIAIPESYLSKIPNNLSFEEAASVPLTGLTAYQSLIADGILKKGQNILILGASGGVGSVAVQLARHIGAKVYAVAGSGREEYLRSLGADHIIDYSKGNFVEQLSEKLPGGADLVYDCVGGETGKLAYQSVKKGGTLVSIAAREDSELTGKYGILFKYVFVEPNSSHLDELRELIESGILKIHIQKIFDMNDIANAHLQMETGHTNGKIVLKIP